MNERRCPRSEDWIAFYGDETDPREAGRLAAHLNACPRCQEEFDQLSRLGAGLRGTFLAQATPAQNRRPAFRRKSPAPARRSIAPIAVAAGLAVAVLAVVLLQGGSRDGDAPISVRIPQVRTEIQRPEAARSESAMKPPPAPITPPATPSFMAPVDSLERTAAPDPAPAEPKQADAAPADPTPLPPPESEPKREGGRELPATRPVERSVAVATLERVHGEVHVMTSSGRFPARETQTLLAGQGLCAAGPKSRAVVKFPDGTRMELEEKSVVREIADRGGDASTLGKKVTLSEGTLLLDVSPQPAGQAMVVASPHGEARILGTSLRISVEPESKGQTRVEVLDGKVRLVGPGGVAVDVPGGHAAVLAEGVDLAARPIPRMVTEVLHRFTFEEGRLPKIFETGSLERGPDRAGNRFSVAGKNVPGATAGAVVKLSDDGKGLFAYSEDLALSFDYWVDSSVSTIDVQVWSRAQQVTFGTTLWNTPRERWTHAAISLSELVRGGPERALHLKNGERVPNLWIQPGQPGGMLFLDNLDVVRLHRKEGRR